VSSRPPVRVQRRSRGSSSWGYPDEDGLVANLPDEVLSRNGNYLPYPRLEEHVALFRVYLHENSENPR